MPIDDTQFRQVMGHFASGVTVVTTELQGQLYGLTVSSFTSLSLDPQLILICIDRKLGTHEILQAAGRFAINILAKDQEHLSRRFASRDIDKYQGVAYHVGGQGVPLLEGVLATIECRIHSTAPGGDHTVFVGEVVDAQVFEGEPLLYYRSGYHELQ
jgi:flavin reductase (DIM6/NTAB) family NADH-FMN oxidoreductase RutF